LKRVSETPMEYKKGSKSAEINIKAGEAESKKS
jgi:hypothetical protein